MRQTGGRESVTCTGEDVGSSPCDDCVCESRENHVPGPHSEVTASHARKSSCRGSPFPTPP